MNNDSKLYLVLSLIVLVIVGLAWGTGCRQKMVKNFGGSMTINLEPNTKLVNATWKDAQLWLLTTARTNGQPQTYNFSEKSAMGILQGNVKIVEK